MIVSLTSLSAVSSDVDDSLIAWDAARERVRERLAVSVPVGEHALERAARFGVATGVDLRRLARHTRSAPRIGLHARLLARNQRVIELTPLDAGPLDEPILIAHVAF